MRSARFEGTDVDLVRCDYSCKRVKRGTGGPTKSRRRVSSSLSATPSLEFDLATINSSPSSPNSSTATEEMDYLDTVKSEKVDDEVLAQDSTQERREGTLDDASNFSYFNIPDAPVHRLTPIYHPVPMTISLFSPLTQFPLAFPKIVPPSPSYHPCLPAHFSNTLHVLDTLTLPTHGQNDTTYSPIHNFSLAASAFANITPFGRLELDDDHAMRAGWGGIPRSRIV